MPLKERVNLPNLRYPLTNALFSNWDMPRLQLKMKLELPFLEAQKRKLGQKASKGNLTLDDLERAFCEVGLNDPSTFKQDSRAEIHDYLYLNHREQVRA